MSDYRKILNNLGVQTDDSGSLEIFTPIDGSSLGKLTEHTPNDIDEVAKNAQAAFLEWRTLPAPARGELVGLHGEALRAAENDLGKPVAMDWGKNYLEGLGEGEEMMDI